MRARFRFSPSPTGPLHISQVRTALFNWAFSRALNGDLIIRLADSRAETQLLNDLAWLGIGWDEGPDIGGEYAPYQLAARRQRNIEVARQLYAAGHAYYSDDSIGQIEVSKGALQLRFAPESGFQVEDALRGSLAIDLTEPGDVMLLDADGEPTLLLATVVADHDMAITHVVQDEADIATVPLQAYLCRLLGWSEPTWIHLPAIYSDSGELLTGQTGRYTLTNLQQLGYLPQAIFNYLLLLGWNPAKGEAIIDKWEVRQQFKQDDLVTTPVQFDWDQLGAINRHYLDKLPEKELMEQILPFLEEVHGELPAAGSMLPQLVRTIRPNLKRLGDAPELAKWAFERPEGYDSSARQALRAEPAAVVLIRLIAVVARLVLLDVDSAAGLLHNLRDELGQQYGWQESQIMPAIRAALTGATDGPPPDEIMGIIGQAETLQRLAAALHWRRE